MNLQAEFSQLLALTTTFDFRFAIFLFAICAIGEFGIAVPYVLDTIWLFVGFRLGSHELSLVAALGLWVAAQAGRQFGCLALYHFSRVSSARLARFFQSHHGFRFFSGVGSKLVGHLNVSGAFSVALGRLIGLRLPITLLAGARRAMKPLLWGVLLSSVVFDAIFIVSGIAVGTTTHLNPQEMFLASLVGLTMLYVIVLVFRTLHKKNRKTGGFLFPNNSE